MTAYEDAKEKLENSLPEHIEKVGEFMSYSPAPIKLKWSKI